VPQPKLDRSNWDRAPHNRWSFQHVAEILPTAEISRGPGPVSQLQRIPEKLDALSVIGLDGSATTLADFLFQSFTDGMLVLRSGAIVYEGYFGWTDYQRYRTQMDAGTPHLSQSVAKSFTGMLAGILAGRGTIVTGALVTDILPELASTAYRGATIQHLLDMTSGVRFNEDYTDPFSHMARLDAASGWKPVPAGSDPADWPRSVFELILGLSESEAAHGERFAYRSIETDVLAFVLERATGKRLPQLLSEELWQPLGMEQNGSMTVDPTGYALADGGLNACLRDYGRFGQMILDGGAGVVPASWIEATRMGNHATFGTPYTAVLPEGAYRNQFWIEDQRSRNLMARGVFGQLIHIDFERQIVVVKLSSWPHFVNPGWTRATIAVAHRIGEALT
jgi:CubicO group peptidase (beta-lactamase class C family)